MPYDMYGRWVPDTAWDQRSRNQNAAVPGYSNYGQPTPGAGYAYNQPGPGAAYGYGPQPAGLSVTPKMYHADIVPIKSEADVNNDIVPPNGEARMYMSEDDRLIATKRVGPNGVETRFYDRRPDSPPQPHIDPQSVVLRSEIDDIVNRIIDDRISRNAQPEPIYNQPDASATRAPAKTGGKPA